MLQDRNIVASSPSPSPSPSPAPSVPSIASRGWSALRSALIPSGALLNVVPTTSVGVATSRSRDVNEWRRETIEEENAANEAAVWHLQQNDDEEQVDPTIEEEEEEEQVAEEQVGEVNQQVQSQLQATIPQQQQQQQHDLLRSSYSSIDNNRDSSRELSGVRFHIDDDDAVAPPKDEETRKGELGKQSTTSLLSSSSSRAAAGGAPGVLTTQKSRLTWRGSSGIDNRGPGVAESTAEERLAASLSKFTDPDIRAILDPNSSTSLAESDIIEWPTEKVISLVKAVEIEHVEGLLKKLARRHMALNAAGGNDDTANATTPLTSMSWRNLYYSVNDTFYLQNVSGYIKPGEIVAVIGGPDAGITTLLDVLSGRTQSRGQLLGDIFVNRRGIDETLARQIGYVQKTDIHLPQLTVSETLYFSARLRNPGISHRIALLRTAFIMKLLGLLHTWNTPIGDDIIRGVSGGEKRRVSFGLEFVAGHNMLIADLPTNGLDSGAALALIQVVRSTTVIGRSLLCSLAQPSPAIFALLDSVCVLSKGSQIYFGPAGLAESYFASLGFLRPHNKSVPQFLEELSAAPERFITKHTLLTPVSQTNERPIARIMNRMNQKKLKNRRLTSQKSLSSATGRNPFMSMVALDGGGVNPYTPKGLQQQKSLVGINDSAISSSPHEVRIAMDQFNKDEVPATNSSHIISTSNDTILHDSHSRRLAWRRAVDGFSSSILMEDIGYVLFHDMMPLPQFTSTKKKKTNKKQQPQPLATDDDISFTTSPSPPPPSSTAGSHYATSFRIQYVENVRRLSILFYRDRGLWLLNFIKSILIGLLVGTLFYRLSLSQSNVRSRFGLFYFIMSFNTANAQQLVPALLSYRKVFQLHKMNEYYRPMTYYLALVTVNIPIALLESFLFLVIVYPLAGLHGGIGSTQFGYCYLMLILVNLVARSYAVFLSSVTSTEALTNILNGLSLVIFSIFSGYLNPRSSIPPGWIWAYYISYYTWAMRGLSMNEHQGLLYDCDTSVPGGCLYPRGEDVLELYDMNGTTTDKWFCILWMSLFLVGFNILSAFALIHVNLTGRDTELEPDFEPVQMAAATDKASNINGKKAVIMASDERSGPKDSLLKGNEPHEQIELVNTHAYAQPQDRPAEKASLLTVSPQHHEVAAASSNKSIHLPDASHEGGYISWRNLVYTVPIKDSPDRTLLDNVFGYCQPGMMVALMGSSGAGKTTLLDVLANKKTGGKITGELLVNGVVRDNSFYRIAGYVEQWDSHHEKSTVLEAVRFSAMLRLPSSVTSDAAEVDRRVKRVLEQVGLSRIQHDIIGSPSSGGINQESRKKLTIAVELISSPRILFLDEPTTGLDSAAAIDVMQCVVELSRSMHMAVICTIHQPSKELINLFDYLCLMQSGGRTIYHGPLASMPSFFESCGMTPYRHGDNIADYAIQCAKSASLPNGDPIDLKVAFANSSFGKEALARIDRGITPQPVREAWIAEQRVIAPKGASGAIAPVRVQLSQLLGRFWRGLTRSPDVWIGRLFATLLMSFITGTCFFQLGSSQQDAQNRVAALFLTVQFVMGSGALKLPSIFAERAVVFRERQAEMYDNFTYHIIRIIHDWPLVLVENFFFAVMVYFICHFNSSSNYTHFALFYLLLIESGQLGFALSELIALCCPTPAIAYTVQGLVSTIFSLFSGFLISLANMPIGWKWANYLSPNKYPLSAALQNEMRSQIFSCDPAVRFAAAAPLCGPSVIDAAGMRCPLACGEELLDGLDVPSGVSDEVLYFFIIIIYVVAFRIFGFLAFKYINHIRR